MSTRILDEISAALKPGQVFLVEEMYADTNDEISNLQVTPKFGMHLGVFPDKGMFINRSTDEIKIFERSVRGNPDMSTWYPNWRLNLTYDSLDLVHLWKRMTSEEILASRKELRPLIDKRLENFTRDYRNSLMATNQSYVYQEGPDNPPNLTLAINIFTDEETYIREFLSKKPTNAIRGYDMLRVPTPKLLLREAETRREALDYTVITLYRLYDELVNLGTKVGRDRIKSDINFYLKKLGNLNPAEFGNSVKLYSGVTIDIPVFVDNVVRYIAENKDQ